jgi:hypothetical protein
MHMILKFKFTLILISISLLSFSQLEIKETNLKIDKTKQPALLIEIPRLDAKTVEKEWKSKMKEFKPDNYQAKKILFADNAIIPSISENTVDVYASVEEKDAFVTLIVAVDLGGRFIDGGQVSQQMALENIMRKFSVQIAKDAYNKLISNQEDILKGLEKSQDEQKKLEQSNEEMKKQIEENEKTIHDLIISIEDQIKIQKEAQNKLDEIKEEASKIN